ncbi:hypothetical protein SC9_00478 [Enterococcus faecalis EnGen0101]|nr:hypothetical protein SC9_03191 [Enterococcus faecalis EnGen0101]EOF43588.1 hypothetical protein SC9_00545 [Enterococcus faecalis EnGen0101]EOF44808.1 hypothetical protein SC9_00478 [Enterococcus faecalis EnGen0101]PQG27391.1 hypothetical protein CUS39_05100 [Enterococcus faecalis]
MKYPSSFYFLWKDKGKKMSKTNWKIIIIFATIMFIYSLLARQIGLTILALVLSFITSKQNLFKEYDKKQAEKRQKFRNMMIEHKKKQQE